MQLRPYQQKGVEDIRAEFRRGIKRVCFQSPTGSGKTVLFSYIARNAAAKGKRVCVMVHRQELLKQTCAKLQYEHGIIWKQMPRTNHLIQVATVQTLTRQCKPGEFDLIVVDESHHSTADTYMKIINMNPNAHVLGVTATPCRMAGTGLGDLFESLVLGPSVQELTQQGYLAPADVYAPSTINLDGVHTRSGDYVKNELTLAVDKPSITGDAISHYKKYADGLPGIAFCVSVQHAEHVAAQFRKAGYISKRIDGGTPERERDGAIAGLAHGDIDVLTSCDLVSEGVDIPVVMCGIMLRPTKSLGLWLQQCGRLLRPSPGKDRAIILDHAGNAHRHGLPDDEISWSLESGADKKKSEKQECPVRQCPKCFYVHKPATTCPNCGHAYEVKYREVDVVEGELELVAKRARMEVGRARDREQLEAIARSRGYKRGWVERVLAARAAKKRQKQQERQQSLAV